MVNLQTKQQRVRRFSYTAIDANTRLQSGHIEASDLSDAARQVRARGMQPARISPEKRILSTREFHIPGFGPSVSASDIAIFTRQFATMTSSGVPLLRGITILSKQTDNQQLAASLGQIRIDIESGSSLSNAVQAHPDTFNSLFVPMLKAGEAAGALDEVLNLLATALERAATTKHKVKAALTYPATILGLVLLVIIAMLIFVVPVFAGIYDDLGGTLPGPTRALVFASSTLTRQLPVICLGVGVLGFGFTRWRATTAGRLRWDTWVLSAPLLGSLIHKAAIARLTRVLCVLSQAGVPVLEALNIAAETVDNSAISAAVWTVRDQVRDGQTLTESMSANPLFPPVLVQLISVGEETGRIVEMLETVADSIEEEVEIAIDAFSAVLEPILMSGVGVAVGGMVVALYLPMFRIVDLVQ